jgi:hypothetical protein
VGACCHKCDDQARPGEGAIVATGGGQQLGTFAGALGGQDGVAAAHQPLPGKVWGGDVNEVVFVEQGQLQGVGLHEGSWETISCRNGCE